MGMPITVEVVDPQTTEETIDMVFDYFDSIDKKFSTYKGNSEISAINRGELTKENWSTDMKEVFDLSEKTRQETFGYFDIAKPDQTFDPSGLVKGWSIWNAAKLLEKKGFENFFVDAGGDIQVHGKNSKQKIWSVGIRNPFKQEENVKIVYLEDKGIATSGTYIRGQHIYNPHKKNEEITDIVSLSVVGQNVYEADRFATAAFAMGRSGLAFIEGLEGLEGYMIDAGGIGFETSNFQAYTQDHA